MGYTTLTDPDRYGLSLVLGGGEIKLLEHVNAFSVFAREGLYKEVTPILKVEDENSDTLEEYKDNRGERVISKKVSRMINSILSDNEARAYAFGISNYLTLGDRPVAAKTGTTNSNRDAWTIGYTPSIATGVWVGNNDNSEMKYGADGSVVAAPIWRNYMQQALINYPVEYFTKPEYENSSKPMLGGNLEEETVYQVDKISGLLATEYTPEDLIIEKKFNQVHSILYYINKNDPLGPIPENPENDPYFSNFEESVLKWAEEEGYNNQKPPTEYDNIHLPEDIPYINIGEPLNSQTITDNYLNVVINASAPRGISKIEYWLADQLINTSYQYSPEQNLIIPLGIPNGNQQLKVIVFDDLENNNNDTKIIILNRENSLEINWLNPATSTSLSASDFPYELILNINNINQVKKIDFYIRSEATNQSSWINYQENPVANNISTYWTSPPEIGTYKIYTVIKDINDNTFNGPEITVSIEE
jgi:membrane carboxypeptidase/penicillin-binding protein PbpC